MTVYVKFPPPLCGLSLEFNCAVTFLCSTETLLCFFFIFTAFAVGQDIFYGLVFGIFLFTVGSNCLMQYISDLFHIFESPLYDCPIPDSNTLGALREWIGFFVPL